MNKARERQQIKDFKLRVAPFEEDGETAVWVRKDFVQWLTKSREWKLCHVYRTIWLSYDPNGELVDGVSYLSELSGIEPEIVARTMWKLKKRRHIIIDENREMQPLHYGDLWCLAE